MTASQIITAVATPLNAIALAMIIMCALALKFFAGEKDWRIRMAVFSLMLLSAGLLSFSLLRASIETKPTEAKGPVETPAPVARPASALCDGVDFSEGNAGVRDAVWCGSPFATLSTRQQSSRFHTASCDYYATRDFADLAQNDLYRKAKELAKGGKDDDAFERILACQCHNPTTHQEIVRSNRIQVICHLKNSS